jgi:hypothetical protein
VCFRCKWKCKSEGEEGGWIGALEAYSRLWYMYAYGVMPMVIGQGLINIPK